MRRDRYSKPANWLEVRYQCQLGDSHVYLLPTFVVQAPRTIDVTLPTTNECWGQDSQQLTNVASPRYHPTDPTYYCGAPTPSVPFNPACHSPCQNIWRASNHDLVKTIISMKHDTTSADRGIAMAPLHQTAYAAV